MHMLYCLFLRLVTALLNQYQVTLQLHRNTSVARTLMQYRQTTKHLRQVLPQAHEFFVVASPSISPFSRAFTKDLFVMTHRCLISTLAAGLRPSVMFSSRKNPNIWGRIRIDLSFFLESVRT